MRVPKLDQKTLRKAARVPHAADDAVNGGHALLRAETPAPGAEPLAESPLSRAVFPPLLGWLGCWY
ncbi:unnamed protein product [Camellia sinensis]